MSELRYNPFLKDWVMVASQRQARPDMPKGWCPFCPGSGKVPDHYDVYAYDNDFPVMQPEWSETTGNEDDFFQAKRMYGKCEVILYHPDHTITLPELPVTHIRKLVDLWCARFDALSQDKNIKYIFIFENRGKESGVTMPHPHGQLYAFSWIPKIIQTELDASKEHNDSTGKCLMCELAEKESACGKRMVCSNDSFSVFVPYFTAWPYGVYIVPNKHTGNIIELNDVQKDDLADILKKVTGAYDTLFDKSFPYMMAFHQTPVNTEDASAYYHFHIEFYPPLRARESQYFRASCETGAGAYCNVTLPEEKAAELREAYERFISKGR